MLKLKCCGLILLEDTHSCQLISDLRMPKGEKITNKGKGKEEAYAKGPNFILLENGRIAA